MITPLENCKAVTDYINRLGAKWKTLFTANIEIESFGYMKEVSSIRFTRRGEVFCQQHLKPTEEEAEAIAEEVSRIQFPDIVTVAALSPASMSSLMLKATDEELFIFKNGSGEICFVQVRVELDNGDKRYVPQTYWSDGEWRAVEPEEGLPIYGIEHVRPGDRVFLHEGAKAARAAQRIADGIDHPFSSYFSTGKHVGWVGGAHYIWKTVWSDLVRQCGELVIVPDNDYIGRSGIAKISRRFNCPAQALLFDGCWPPSWDCADSVPADFFSDDGTYIGPDLADMLSPCDKATEEVGLTDNGKPIYGVTEQFASQWCRVQRMKHYVHVSKPEISFDREQFNVQVRPYSDVAETANLLAKVPGNISTQLTFLPGKPTGLVYQDGEMQFNQYKDRRIKPLKGGTIEPFNSFMEYLFPEEAERVQVVRWMATLYACPSAKMNYAILLLSKLQGVGKSTLMNILSEMIGRKHVSFPGDAMIQSDFNSWIINKRFVAVHEIYAGQNWKAYNRLKPLITEEMLEANSKHLATYTFPSCVHFMAASNSLEALRIENDDRRWYVPKLPETFYSDYNQLYEWIRQGGLKYLAQHFMDFEGYVKPGEHAPKTQAKLRLIEQSMPMDERLVVTLIDRLSPGECLDVQDVWVWLQEEARGRAYATPQRIISLLGENGYHVDDPFKIGNRKRQLIWSSKEDYDSNAAKMNGTPVQKHFAQFIREPGDIFADKSPM